MKQKILLASTALSAIIVIVSASLSFITECSIPGLTALAAATTMILVYSNKKLTHNQLIIKVLFLVAAFINIVVGMMQIFSALS